MDTNNMSMGYYGGTGLPVGFSMALAMNEVAMKRYAQLSETEKEHLILRCKDAGSKEEVRKIVNELGMEDGVI